MRTLRSLFSHTPTAPAPSKYTVPSIPGSYLFFCATCYRGFDTYGRQDKYGRPDETCPYGHGPMQFVANSLRGPMEPPMPSRPFLRPRVTPQENVAATLTEFRTPKDAA